jgi:hypothetical protein
MTTSPSDDGPPAAAPRVVSIAAAKKPRRRAPPWLDGAIHDERRRILANLRNAALALRSAPELKGAFRFDELQRLVIVDKPLPLSVSMPDRFPRRQTLPESLQKALDMLADIGRRLDVLERGEKLPLWLRQASEKSASASPAFPSMIPAPSLAKAALGLPTGSTAEAVLSELLADPSTAETVRTKIQQMRSFP